MRYPVISLLTDFGTSDHFVGVMKGVILGLCPEARIVDITHEITPYELAQAGFVLAQAWRYFPPKSIHVVVVDPGVGTSRRPILAEAGGQFFIAPDNGVLTSIYGEGPHKVRWITAQKYFRESVSHTFHGRDIFAPCAGHLAAGVPAASFGKRVEDYMRLRSQQPERTARRGWTGMVLKIDRFGNVITNFMFAEFAQIEQQAFQISIGMQTVLKLAKNYAEVNPGELFAIAGSSGFIEISSNQASAAKILGVGIGAPVELRLL